MGKQQGTTNVSLWKRTQRINNASRVCWFFFLRWKFVDFFAKIASRAFGVASRHRSALVASIRRGFCAAAKSSWQWGSQPGTDTLGNSISDSVEFCWALCRWTPKKKHSIRASKRPTRHAYLEAAAPIHLASRPSFIPGSPGYALYLYRCRMHRCIECIPGGNPET